MHCSLFFNSTNSIFSQTFASRLSQQFQFPVVQVELAFPSHFWFLIRFVVDSHRYAMLDLMNVATVESSWPGDLIQASALLSQCALISFCTSNHIFFLLSLVCLLYLFHLLCFPFVENIKLYHFVCSANAVLWCFLICMSSTCDPAHLLSCDVC